MDSQLNIDALLMSLRGPVALDRFLLKNVGSPLTPVCLSGLSNEPFFSLFPPLRTMKLAFPSLWV